MKKTYKMVSIGCKVNAYELDAIAEKLNSEGYQMALFDDEVDVLIINTCAVTHTAAQKSRQIKRREIKKHPNSISVVMGCYSQINKNFISDIPNISIVLGTSNRDKVFDYIRSFEQNKEQIVALRDNPRQFEYEELGACAKTLHTRAYLKIQDGCDNFCSYCIIPHARGKSRSRSFDEAIKEAKELTNLGYKEIVLTGINTGTYGQDIGTNLTELIKEIIRICPSLYRLRISSIEANEVTEELIALISKTPMLAKHLHIPLQSGNDEILNLMNRKYTIEDFKNKIDLIRKYMPEVAITTDVIVGFPTETEEQFISTYEFIKKMKFSDLHVFPYSQRKGTKAAILKEQIVPDIKKERVSKLLTLANELSKDYASKFLNKEVEVLIEYFDKSKNAYFGHTSNYLPLYIKSDEYIKHKVIKTLYKIRQCRNKLTAYND